MAVLQDRQQTEGRHLRRQSTVRSWEHKYAHPPHLPHLPDITCQISPSWVGIFSPTWCSPPSKPLRLTTSLFSQGLRRQVSSYANSHKADWEGFTLETERRFAETPLPTLCSPGEKVFWRFSAMLGDTISPMVMSGTIATLSPMLCGSSSRRETSIALMTLSTLPSSCWTGTSSSIYARKRKTIRDSSWILPTAPQSWGVTGHSCAGWARSRVPHGTSPAWRRLREPQAVHCQVSPSKLDTRKGSPPQPSGGPLIQAIQRERCRSSH